MFHGRMFSASAGASESLWVQVGIDVCIPHWKNQVKPHSSPWFSAACAAAIVHRNHFIVCTNRINISNVKFRQARIVVKGFLKLSNLHMLIKQKSQSLPSNFTLGTFGKLLVVFSTNVNLLYLLYSTAQEYCLLQMIKENCLLKSFLKTLLVMTQVYLYLFFLLELIWNCMIFL